MPTFNDPVADSDELREAARGLAHATRTIDDPSAIYRALGALSAALGSLSQSLHQLGDFHDAPRQPRPRVDSDIQAGRAASYAESWELHRAAEMLQQVAATIDRAHQIEATLAYDTGPRLVPPPPISTPTARPAAGAAGRSSTHGMSL